MFDLFDIYSPTVSKKDNNYLLSVPAMGYRQEDCDVTADGDTLTVLLKRDGKTEHKFRYSLEANMDSEAISAKLDLGILTVTIPTQKQAARKVPVT